MTPHLKDLSTHHDTALSPPTAAMKSHATFIHVSDFHFGELRGNSEDAHIDPHWRFHHLYDGFLGHHKPPLNGLAVLAKKKLKEENVHFLFTGDLTSWATPDQFDTGDKYLGSKIRIGGGKPIGLGLEDWSDQSIAGNHDHWPGKRRRRPPRSPAICGSPNDHLDRVIGTDADMTLIKTPDISIRLMMIDSCADVASHGIKRFLARGSFVSHIDELNEKLRDEAPPEREIRVLLLHHSLAPQKPYTPHWLAECVRAFEIDRKSQEALSRFLIDWNVSALLTGHIHTPHVHRRVFKADGRQQEVLEARCGTTAVISDLSDENVPPKWRDSPFVSNDRLEREPNTLLLHEIVEENGNLYWQTETYVLNTGGDFVPATPSTIGRDQEEMDKLQLHDRLQLL